MKYNRALSQSSKYTGNKGEKIALNYLIRKRYKLIQKNFFIWGGEIDLIMKKDDILIFVEVKTRTSTSFGSPEESVTKKKKRDLCRAIDYYLQVKNTTDDWQCDLISIFLDLSKRKAYIEHIPNIFLE